MILLRDHELIEPFSIGDKVLVEVSNRIVNAVRFDDIAIRWGGEEFLIICPMAKREFVEKIIANILHSVREEKIDINHSEGINITISIGTVCFPIIADAPKLFTFDRAIVLCDLALYDAKEHGRNHACYVVPTVTSLNETDVSDHTPMKEFFKNPQYCTIRTIQ